MIEENKNKLGFIQLWFPQILITLLSTGESSKFAYKPLLTSVSDINGIFEELL